MKFKVGELVVLDRNIYSDAEPMLLIKYHYGSNGSVRWPTWDECSHWIVLIDGGLQHRRADWVEKYCERVS